MILSDIQIVHREPITSEHPHLSVQIGQTAFAYYDTLSRAVNLDEHMRSGTLPASFRYPYQNKINLLQSNLDFKKLSRAYQVSVPPAISVRIHQHLYSFHTHILIGFRVHVRNDVGVVPACN